MKRCSECYSSNIVAAVWSPPPGGIDPPVIPTLFCHECGEPVLSSAHRKKWKEMTYTHYLRGGVPELTGMEIEPWEAPDFLLQSPSRTIGLELTAMVRGGTSGELPPKVRFEFREKVKAMARRVYMERGLPPVWVNLRWSPSGARGRIEGVAEKLADLVAERTPVVDPKDGWGKCELAWEELPEALKGHLTGLTIMQNPAGTATTWTAGWAGYPDLDRDELVAEIRRKEQVAAGYVTRYDELWLMVYATGMGEAEYLLLPPEANSTAIATTFHRVYFMDGEQKVTEVAIERAQPLGK